jgi:hypothetical protein
MDPEDQEIEVQPEPESPEPEEIETEAAAPSEPEEDRPSRRERRRARGEDIIQAERQRADAAERRAQEALQAMQQLAQRPVIVQAPQPQQQPQQPQQNPYEYEAYLLRQEQERVTMAYNDAARRGDHATLQQLEQQAWSVRDRMEKNAFRRNYAEIQREMPQRQQASQQQITPEVIQAEVAKVQLMEKHGDVISDRRAANIFRAKYAEALAMDQPDNWDTIDRVAEQTRMQLRMKPKNGKVTTDAQRARFGGMRTGATGTPDTGRKVVKMDKFARSLADAAFPHIKDDGKRYQHWANTVGAKIPE